MTKTRDLSKYIAVDGSTMRLNRIWASVTSRLPFQARMRRWQSVSAVAALALCVILVTWRLALHSQPQLLAQEATVETASDTSSVKLRDGSRLVVAARTRIEWSERDAHSTLVKLAHGTVNCEVVARPGRQFSVAAGDVRVQVTGTRFSVSYNPESGNVGVAVQRGSVSVLTPGSTERHLGAGEQWMADRATVKSETATTSSASRSTSEPPSATSAPSNAAPEISSLPPSVGGDVPTPTAQELPSARSLMDQGSAARRAGDSRAAANAYQTLLSRFPRDPRAGLAAFELGRLRMGPLGDVQGAVRAFQSAIALSPGSAIREDSMAHLVEAYAVSGQNNQCSAARDAYLKSYPNGVHVTAVRRQCGGS